MYAIRSYYDAPGPVVQEDHPALRVAGFRRRDEAKAQEGGEDRPEKMTFYTSYLRGHSRLLASGAPPGTPLYDEGVPLV